jgi:hypothetical protein
MGRTTAGGGVESFINLCPRCHNPVVCFAFFPCACRSANSTVSPVSPYMGKAKRTTFDVQGMPLTVLAKEGVD